MRCEIFEQKLTDLKFEVIQAIIDILSRNGDEVDISYGEFEYIGRDGETYYIVGAEIDIRGECRHVKITKEGSTIQFDTELIQDELDVYQCINFLEYLEINF